MLPQINNNYFSKLVLVGFQHKPVSLDVNKVCFDEEHDIPNTREKSSKSQSVTEWYKCRKFGVKDTNVECLSCGEIRALDTSNYQI